MSSINSEIKKNPSTTPARGNSSSIFSSSLIGNSTGTNLSNSQFSNYLNIPSNNTLGHLPRKPGPNLTTINTTNTNKRGSSIVTGVLSPNANQSTLSPNSIGFGKKSPQLFGRVGLTDINPTPNLSSGGITNNNNNNNSSSSSSSTSNGSARMTVDKNNRSFPPLKLANPTTQSTLSKVKINSPISRTPTTNSSSNTSTTLPISSSSSTATARKLGSFNSLAVSNSKPYQALNAPLVSPNSASNLTVQDVNESLKDDLRDSNALRTSLAGSIGQQHRLRFKWVFWVLHRAPSKKMSEEEFGRAMRRIGSCDTVETFYSLYLHIKRPSNQTPISDLHLFADPIKPVWEDENNVKGGKWTIKLRKGLSDRLWESLMMSLVGGGLERLIGSNGLNEICGVVLSVRKDEDILAVWHRTGHSELGGDGKMAKQVKLSLQTVLQLPLNCNLIYKLNAESLANGTFNQHHNNQHQHHHHHTFHHNQSSNSHHKQHHPHNQHQHQNLNNTNSSSNVKSDLADSVGSNQMLGTRQTSNPLTGRAHPVSTGGSGKSAHHYSQHHQQTSQIGFNGSIGPGTSSPHFKKKVLPGNSGDGQVGGNNPNSGSGGHFGHQRLSNNES